MTESDRIRPNPTNYLNRIRPNPTESDRIRPESDRIRPNPTKSDPIRLNPTVGFGRGSFRGGDLIIEKVVKKNKRKLYAVFIDFKKAYDTVDRRKLFTRLQDIGINGIFLKNIKAMYENISYKIKLKDGFLDPITSNLGLKQGCPLSPMLFNLYIDDVKEIFDAQCEPVTITDTNISHFLYADDLVLISLSPEGLQRSLDKISEFSNRNDKH